jgi:RNA-directed DNA polymerase
VILVRGYGNAVLDWVTQRLARWGLTLHPEKTRSVHAKEGFDFLGGHFRLRSVKKQGARLTSSCRRWPSNRSMQRIKTRVKEVIGRRYSLSLEEMIQELNPTIRGWNTSQTRVQADQKRCRFLNRFVWDRGRIFLKRTHRDSSRGCRRASQAMFRRLGLIQVGRSWCFNGNGC